MQDEKQLIRSNQVVLEVNLKQSILMTSFFIALLFLYGFIPHLYISSLSAHYLTVADVQAILNQGIFDFSYVKNFGIELGFPFLTGLPFNYFAAAISVLFGVDASLSITLAGFFILLIAYLSMFFLLRQLGVNSYVAIFCSYLYFILPINYGQIAYGTMLFGFILLPTSVLIDMQYLKLILNKENVGRSHYLFIFFYPLFKILMLFLDGYAFVFSILVSVMMVLFFCWHYFSRMMLNSRHSFIKEKSNLIALSIYVTSPIVALISYKGYVPGGANYHVMPIDFFRAAGVDLMTLIVPNPNFYLLHLIGVTKSWDALAYYGDGSNVYNNYLGYTLIFMFIAFLSIRLNRGLFINAIVAAGFLGLILSLGPSLKINDFRSTAANEALTFSSYLMPPADATFNLQTDGLYTHIPGIKNIRAVHRWLLVFIFSLVIISALYLTSLAKKNRKKIALTLCALALMELQPNLSEKNRIYQAYYAEKNRFDEDLAPLKKYVKPNDKIFFLSNQNDFMANYLSAGLNARSYNVGGDKNFVLSAATWPKAILNIRAFDSVNENAFIAMSGHQLDKLVLPYFRLREESYHWPPSEDERLAYKNRLLSELNVHDSRFKFQDEKWFGIISLNK